MNAVELKMINKVLVMTLSTLELLERNVQLAISLTPTSDKRNLLTDASIHVVQAKGKLISAMEETK